MSTVVGQGQPDLPAAFGKPRTTTLKVARLVWLEGLAGVPRAHTEGHSPAWLPHQPLLAWCQGSSRRCPLSPCCSTACPSFSGPVLSCPQGEVETQVSLKAVVRACICDQQSGSLSSGREALGPSYILRPILRLEEASVHWASLCFRISRFLTA